MKKEFKTYYFFVMLNVKGEPVTNATRFKYFLVYEWGNANSDEIEMKANKKIYKIAELLSQQDNVQYKVANIDAVATNEFNVLKKHFPTYSYHKDTLMSINTTGDTDDEE
jgi:hypothetical protein